MAKVKPPHSEVKKKVKNMNREELLHYATSVAQHANKTIRDFEKAGKEHLFTPSKLVDIAEQFNLKTKKGRVSRSFKKLSDDELRDFITDTRNTYTNKVRGTLKLASEDFNRRRLKTIGAIEKAFSSHNVDIDKIKNLSEEDFSNLYEMLSQRRGSEAKSLTSNEIIANFLKDYNAINDEEEEDIALSFQKSKSLLDRLNRNNALNRNGGRRR